MAVMAAGCTDDPIEPVENHDVVFGSGGTPSSSANELFAKSDGVTNTDVVGVYETKGTASGLYDVPNMDGVVGIVKNNFTRRVEIREGKIVTALKCELVYTSPDRPGKTLMVFVSQNASFANNVFTILEEGGQGETDQDSFTECSLMLPMETWAMCAWQDSFPDGTYQLPTGATNCVAPEDGELNIYRKSGAQTVNVESAGLKVAN